MMCCVQKRQWQREQSRRLAGKIQNAVARGRAPATVARLIGEYSTIWNSGDRLPRLLVLLRKLPASYFWKALAGEWAICDDTWAHLPKILALMRRYGDYAPARQRGGGNDEFVVYRGCSRTRVFGISWTRSRSVAEGFARGHRLIPVPDPVIVSARVRRSAVFMFSRGRCEREVVLDPTGLSHIAIRSFTLANPLDLASDGRAQDS